MVTREADNGSSERDAGAIWSDSIIYFSPDVNAYVKGKVSGLKIAFRETIERRLLLRARNESYEESTCSRQSQAVKKDHSPDYA